MFYHIHPTATSSSSSVDTLLLRLKQGHHRSRKTKTTAIAQETSLPPSNLPSSNLIVRWLSSFPIASIWQLPRRSHVEIVPISRPQTKDESSGSTRSARTSALDPAWVTSRATQLSSSLFSEHPNHRLRELRDFPRHSSPSCSSLNGRSTVTCDGSEASR